MRWRAGHKAGRYTRFRHREARSDLAIHASWGHGLPRHLPPPPKGRTVVKGALLASGATISEMNCVRRHLSRLKGGRLGALCHPAKLLTLLISDVPGDALMDIASGPTVADSTTCLDALDIIRRYRIDLTAPVRALLESGQGAGRHHPPGGAARPAVPGALRAAQRW